MISISNTMRKGSIAASVATAILMMSGTAHAIYIDGSVAFSQFGPFQTTGPSVTGPSDLLNATGFSFSTSNNLTVVSSTLSGLTPYDSRGTLYSFVFNPSTPTSPLWAITGSFSASPFSAYSFAVSSFTTVLQNANGVTLSGEGLLSLAGYQDTKARWDYSANQTGSSMSFSTSGGTVPAPAVLGLVGLGLIGMGLGRKARRA